VVLLAAAALMAGCGGSSSADEERAKANFGAYRKAEDQRQEAEGELNQAFRDISTAARARDRASAMAAVDRGQAAVSTIYSTLAVEIEAADALAGYEPTHEHGARLRQALGRTRTGVEAIDRELDIAKIDPFLDVPANVEQIRRLSSQSLKVSAPASFARRRAVRAIALKFGVEPPVDVLFDLPKRTMTSGGGG
jgi:hypothetical protein